MPSVDIRFKSITVKWIRKCFDPTIDARWKYFALFWLSQLGNPYYSKLEWMAAFAFRPTPRNLRSIPYYYQHIYEVRKKCDGGRIAKSPRSLAEAMTEPLWGNPCIRAGGRPLFYPSLACLGFINFGDLFSHPDPPQTARMRTLLARVVAAIPRDWWLLPPTSMRDSRSSWQQQLYLFISSDTPVSLNDAVSRTVYRRLLQPVIQEPSCVQGWRKTNPSVRTRDLHKLWDLPKVCKVSLGQDRDLYWKLIHRVLPTNRFLFYCGLPTTDACPSCNLAPDTTEHIFGECPLWQKTVGLVFNLPSLRRYRIIRRATHFIQFTTRCKESLITCE